MPVRTSTGYHLLVIRCRWCFLATRLSGYPYLSHTYGVPDYDVIIDMALSHHQSHCIAVTRYVFVVYNVCPSMPIHHFASLFLSTTIQQQPLP